MQVLCHKGDSLGIGRTRTLVEVNQQQQFLRLTTYRDDVQLLHASDRAQGVHHVKHRRELHHKAWQGGFDLTI